jgi:hypothetical protein
MSVKLMPQLRSKHFIVSTGAVNAGGSLTFTVSGTSTPLAAYTDATGGSAVNNPLTLDSNGEAEVWLTAGTLYRIVVKDAAGVQQHLQDGVSVDSTGTLAIASGGTSATTKAGAFDALSPMTTAGDVIYGGASGTGTRLARGTATQVLHSGTTPSFSAVDLAADVTGALPVANGGTNQTTAVAAAAAMQTLRVTLAAADGAISVKDGIVIITKPGVCVLTLAAPTGGTDDGKQLTILSATAFAHTVTQAAPGFNAGGGASDVATFGGAIGDSIEVVAYGVWYVKTKTNVSLA